MDEEAISACLSVERYNVCRRLYNTMMNLVESEVAFAMKYQYCNYGFRDWRRQLGAEVSLLVFPISLESVAVVTSAKDGSWYRITVVFRSE